MITIFAFLFGILPPCATDADVTWCAWNAQEQGNGKGTSYVVLNNAEQVWSVQP
ncbi:MAG TPA: hypothetical protein VHK27_04970 [Gammaproteobacteria bacterium]|nr:hypothetical protein [Gammaproteobacteria bacterium]